MKVGYYAPLPPARTGVAQYAEALLRALRSRVEIAVNSPGEVNLYHIGNNALHRNIYERALAQPGVVILHDAVLHHLLLGSLGREGYIQEFIYNYGGWSYELATELWAHRARSAADPRFFRYPMLRRIAERSKVLVVHNPEAAAAVIRHGSQARVVEIPHLYEPAPEPSEIEVREFLQRYGIPDCRCLFGVFGHLRESKRLWQVLRALDRTPGAALVLAGGFASSDLWEALRPELAQRPNVCWTGYLNEADFRRCAHAVDVCVNLKYPAAGETSGVAVRLMGAGKPVILTACGENARFPEDICLRVEAGPCETEMLAHYMAWLMEDRAAARVIGRRARAYVEKWHSLERVSLEIFETICQAARDGAR